VDVNVVTVSVEFTGPPPGVGVSEDGLKEQLRPDGNPEQARSTALLKPFCEPTEIVYCADPPAVIVAPVEAGSRLKSGGLNNPYTTNCCENVGR
jgi:hypothetical protein